MTTKHKKDQAAHLKATGNGNGNQPPIPSLKELLRKKPLAGDVKRFENLLKNCQANILKYHKKRGALFAFIQFEKGKKEEAKKFLIHYLPTNAFDQLTKNPEVVKGLYLSYNGYQYFGVNEHLIPRCSDDAFKEGLLDRTTFGKHQDKTERNYNKTIHVVLMVALEDKDQKANLTRKKLREAAREIRDNLEESGLGEAYFEFGIRKGKANISREWFGFKDGISNPRFFTKDPKNSSPLDLVLRGDTLGGRPYSCGSFMVFLKLQQDVDAFEATVEKVSTKLNKSTKYTEALLIGRFKNGVPLDLSNTGTHRPNQNNFNYLNDPDGNRCPLHAHIRKANQRRPGDEEKRIVRRGITYKNPKHDEKGILFISFQSDLRYQFEDLVNRYLFNYDLTDKDNGSDPILANDYGYRRYSTAWDKKPKKGIRVSQEMVTFKGGAYFFAPSISFIKEVLPNL